MNSGTMRLYIPDYICTLVEVLVGQAKVEDSWRGVQYGAVLPTNLPGNQCVDQG